MPMKWDAENDRILLLKLIETHGISINAEKIAQAWPADAPTKPSGRAVSERFVKIRQLAGLTGTPSKGGRAKLTTNTPSMGRMSLVSPGSSAKKRKVVNRKKDTESEESDFEDNDTPPPTRSTRKADVFRGPGRTVGSVDGPQDDTIVKTEPLDNPFNAADSVADIEKAKELRKKFSTGLPSPITLGNSPSTMGYSEMDFTNYTNANGYDISGDINVGGFPPTTPLQGSFTFSNEFNSIPSGHNLMKEASRFNLTPATPHRHVAGIPLPASPGTPTLRKPVNFDYSFNHRIVTPPQVSTFVSKPVATQRTPRKASQQAVSNIKAWTRDDHEVGKELGEKESDDDEEDVSAFEDDNENMI